MIVTSTSKVESNITQAHDFKISDNSIHLFRMLSDFLYSNKEMCVLHELSANAVDEHKRFGIPDTPIEIVAPTSLEPKLTIRDFGEGLSEDMVYKLLTTYGESGAHKRESNEFFGAWGIGSKSVASVSKTWEIKSYHNDEVSNYLVFINEKGVPSITKSNSTPTDRSGLEIIIPIKSTDIRKWTDLFSSVYQHYTVRPNFKNIKVAFNSIKWHMTGTRWKANNQGSGYGAEHHMAIISYRGYRLDRDKLLKEVKDSRAKTILSQFSGLQFQYEFNTGDLELSLSREVLQYTKHTIASIEKHLCTVFDELKVQFVAAMGSPKNSLEYREAIYLACEKLFGAKNRATDYHFKHGIDALITGNQFGVTTDNISTYHLNSVDQLTHRPKMFNGKMMSTMKSSFTAWKSYCGQYNQKTSEMSVKISYLDQLRFVIADIRDTEARVRHDDKYKGYTIIVWGNYNFPAELGKWVIKASTLPKAVVVRAPRGTRVKVVSEVYQVRRNSFAKVTPNMTAPACYVKFTDARMLNSMDTLPAPFFTNINTHRLILKMQEYGYNVYGVKNGKPAPTWMRSITEEVAHWIATVDQVKLKKSYQTVANIIKDSRTSFDHVFSMTSLKVHPDTTMAKVMHFYKTVVQPSTKESSDYWEQYEEFCKWAGVKVVPPVVENWADVRKTAIDKYPMLKYNDYYSKPSPAEVSAYINLVEGK